MKDAPVLHRLEYALYAPARWALRILPISMCRALGRAGGSLFWLVSRSKRRITLDNLARALPELDRESRQRIARRHVRNFGESLFDALAATRLDGAQLCRRWTLEGMEHVNEAARHERGLIFISGHLGSWEIAAWALALSGHPTTVVGRPPDNPYLLTDMVRMRERHGNRMVGKNRAALALYRELLRGGAIGVHIDQRVPVREAVAASFFGHPVNATPLAAKLSLKCGAPVLGAYAKIEPDGRYRIWFTPPMLPEGDARCESDVVRHVQRYLDAVEQTVRQHPEHWLWMHRRWQLED